MQFSPPSFPDPILEKGRAKHITHPILFMIIPACGFALMDDMDNPFKFEGKDNR